MGMKVNGCCCMNLRTAGLVHGFVGIVIFILATIVHIDYIANKKNDPEYKEVYAENVDEHKISLGICIFDFIISTLILIGIYTKKHLLLLPWLVLRAIALIIIIPFSVLMFVMGLASLFVNPEIMLIAFIYLAACAFFSWSWIVMYSLYLEIRESKRRPLPIQMPSTIQECESQSVKNDSPPPYEVLRF